MVYVNIPLYYTLLHDGKGGRYGVFMSVSWAWCGYIFKSACGRVRARGVVPLRPVLWLKRRMVVVVLWLEVMDDIQGSSIC